jgi:Calx-beta domain-containing protein
MRALLSVPMLAAALSLGALPAQAGVPQIFMFDAFAVDQPAGNANVAVLLSAASDEPVTFSYTTVNGTAVAGQDYVAASGTLTIPPGETNGEIVVSILADGLDEPTETFTLVVSNPVGATIGDGESLITVLDGDPTTEVRAGRCEVQEGAGVATCVLSVLVLMPGTQTVTVDYATANGTATAGLDYLPASGTLTFPPGGPAFQNVPLTVLGDSEIELNELFVLNLTNVTNAIVTDATGEATILDDDALPLGNQAIVHGTRLRADLAAAPGPAVDRDHYVVEQAPYSSWEVVVDEVSGDVAPGLVLDLLAEDNSTVLATGAVVGGGSARSLRWQRRLPYGETRQHVRVHSPSCGTACGADDTYRLRAYETTERIPRFNNSGSQATVVVLHNTTDQPVAGNVDFWQASGILLLSTPVTLAPHGVAVVNAAAQPALSFQSGSITITHDAPYGALAGKAVALEPATGFAFDTPLEHKPK